MTKTPAVAKLLAGYLLLTCSVTHASAQGKYSPADMLDARLGPKLDDVVITVPTPDELKSCTVESIRGNTPNSGGFMLKDAKGTILRRYLDSTGKGKIDMWSYYKDGVEVYREFDTAGKGTPNNFRWLNAGGMKWGVGGMDAKTSKWTITTWRMISAEEAAYEAFQAVAKNDTARMQALFISDAEMQLIKLPAAKVKAIGTVQDGAGKKFADFVKTAKLNGVKFDGVESAIPQCDTNGDIDTIKFASRAIRYAINGKEHGWIHTGEMIQVGMAWRLVDVPTDKENADPNPTKVAVVGGNPKLDKLLTELAELDKLYEKLAPAAIRAGKKDVEAYYSKRVALIKQIIPLEKEAEQENWYKQLFDNLTAQAQNTCDKTTIAELAKLKDQLASAKPGSNVAAYGAYREAWTRYAVDMSEPGIKGDKVAKVQDAWLDDLSEFVKKFSKSDDTPDALSQLAVGCEFAGKIEQAKRWYKELIDSFKDHHHAPRARGSLTRLNLIGNPLTLSAPLLADSSKTFTMANVKGKIVIVHFWSSAASTYESDFAVLKVKMQSAKNVELVCVCLDDEAASAKQAIAKTQAPGIHLFHATNNERGMNSPLATQFGIHILPTVFIVGADGRVTANGAQISDIDTELKKVQ
jgi:Thioredoxin-like